MSCSSDYTLQQARKITDQRNAGDLTAAQYFNKMAALSERVKVPLIQLMSMLNTKKTQQ